MGSEGTDNPKSRRHNSRIGLVPGALLGISPIYKLANLLTAARFVVQGDSMRPNFAGDQYVLVSRLAYLWDGPSRGDVVVLRHPRRRGRHYIKRIIGLPGEHVKVEIERVFINGQLLEEPYLNQDPNHQVSYTKNSGPSGQSPQMYTRDNWEVPSKEWSLDDDQYFAMGDNRADSDDSRSFGPLRRDLVIGRAWICYWPRSAWGFIP